MPRFFTQNINGNTAFIEGDDAKHIQKSLRMKIGEQIELCDQNGFDYIGNISQISDCVEVSIVSKQENESEPDCEVTLFQALPKGDKFELIVQKAVELGVHKIVPMLTDRCVSRPDQKSFAKKLERYNKIALEAAKQSGRGVIPVVEDMVSFDKAIEMASSCQTALFFYEKGGKSLSENLKSDVKSVAIFIGSEGGFEEAEVEKAEKNGILTTSLGKRILRCETAPLCALSAIMYITGNL